MDIRYNACYCRYLQEVLRLFAWNEPYWIWIQRANLFISIPRISANSVESEAIAVDFPAKEQQFYQGEHETRLEVQNPGKLESLVLKEYLVVISLSANFVKIEPAAFGLNFHDVMVALDQFDSTIMGLEYSGIVT